ncbi:MAG: hypothetical protein KatS3mg082_1606 [Nitrospiraceae bacterium]|nr:MAG: hypothetical protein KatS3mg082_1606 [Nitrospiraceae bacterium]
MFGVTDFSIFEQEGADCSTLGVIHAEASADRLRFWFDPQGELYVVCEEAELEEVSKPSSEAALASHLAQWTFQAESGEGPTVEWLLAELDRAGLPCSWKAKRVNGASHPAIRWEGQLIPASSHEAPHLGSVFVQTYGPLDGARVRDRPADVRPSGRPGRPGCWRCWPISSLARFPAPAWSGNTIIPGMGLGQRETPGTQSMGGRVGVRPADQLRKEPPPFLDPFVRAKPFEYPARSFLLFTALYKMPEAQAG